MSMRKKIVAKVVKICLYKYHFSYAKWKRWDKKWFM